MRVLRRLALVFIGVLLLQLLVTTAGLKWLSAMADATCSVLFVVTFWIVPPLAYLMALHGGPPVAEGTLRIGRVIRLAAAAFGLSLVSVGALLLLMLVLHVTLGFALRSPP